MIITLEEKTIKGMIIIGTAICTTELKATICFISVFLSTRDLIMIIPIKDTQEVKIKASLEVIINITRIKPKAPSFRRIPARIIDPYTGASTCALGSQLCRMNIGILAIIPEIKARLIRDDEDVVKLKTWFD